MMIDKSSENGKLNINKVSLSIVMPCFNEENTIGICIKSAQKVIDDLKIDAEILVVDNNSTDRSASIAAKEGARVIVEINRGYGYASRCGIREAKGEIIILIDADTTYDFNDIKEMYHMLSDDPYDVVIGNRFCEKMEKGAMPISHRLGVKALSYLGRKRFKTDVYDFHSGIRGISKKASNKLIFNTTGMEFATEMIAESAKNGLRIGQMQVSLLRCRCDRRSKLRTVRDGIRHLRYIITAV